MCGDASVCLDLSLSMHGCRLGSQAMRFICKPHSCIITCVSFSFGDVRAPDLSTWTLHIRNQCCCVFWCVIVIFEILANSESVLLCVLVIMISCWMHHSQAVLVTVSMVLCVALANTFSAHDIKRAGCACHQAPVPTHTPTLRAPLRAPGLLRGTSRAPRALKGPLKGPWHCIH